MAKILTFYAPKTAGNSIIAFNSALTYQWQNPKQRVALWEWSASNDLGIYTKTEVTRFWQDLEAFRGTDEWSSSLLDKVKYHTGVDVFFSDRDYTGNGIEDIWDLMGQNYDVIFIDISNHISEENKSYCFEKTDKIFVSSCLDPASLSRLEAFLAEASFEAGKVNILITQCPVDGLATARKQVQKLAVRVVEIFPQDTKAVWPQVFEGVPVISHKKSPLAKTIGQFVQTINTL